MSTESALQSLLLLSESRADDGASLTRAVQVLQGDNDGFHSCSLRLLAVVGGERHFDTGVVDSFACGNIGFKGLANE